MGKKHGLKIHYDDVFFENHLLSFKHENHTFIWIGIPFSMDLHEGWRFIKLTFTGVVGYSRKMPSRKDNPFLTVIDEFSTLNSVKKVHSEYSELGFVQSRNKKSLKIVMSYLFGEIEFLFNDVEVEERVGKFYPQATEDHIYRDIQTNELFSFYEPFKK